MKEDRGKKVVRRLTVVWVLAVSSWVIYQVFVDVSQINAHINTALGIVIGILTAVIGYYFKLQADQDTGK